MSDRGQTVLDPGWLQQQEPEWTVFFSRLFRSSRQPFAAFIFAVILLRTEHKRSRKMAIRRVLLFHTLFIREPLFVGDQYGFYLLFFIHSFPSLVPGDAPFQLFPSDSKEKKKRKRKKTKELRKPLTSSHHRLNKSPSYLSTRFLEILAALGV